MNLSSIVLTPENFKNFRYQHTARHFFEFITNTEYQLYTKEGEPHGQPIRWRVEFGDFFKHFIQGGWRIVGCSTNFSFHGPLQPPPSPICLKIREMEARRKCL